MSFETSCDDYPKIFYYSKGVWAPRRIANPDYFEEKNPYQLTDIVALGLRLAFGHWKLNTCRIRALDDVFWRDIRQHSYHE